MVCWWVVVHFDPTSKPITFYTEEHAIDRQFCQFSFPMDKAQIIVQSPRYKISKLKHMSNIKRKIIPHRFALVLIRLEKNGANYIYTFIFGTWYWVSLDM
jgi:hypothetical protein